MTSHLCLVSRESRLALVQTEWVKTRLMQLHPHHQFSIKGMTTEGDQRLSESLVKIGGKGLFVKQLEQALLNKTADCAVHSLKDMPQELPKELSLAAVSIREDARDAFVSLKYPHFNALPKGAVVGTSSLRRATQLLAMRSDIVIKFLRGNLDTRLKKLAAHEYDAIILAAAGLIRLNLKDQITHFFSTEELIPAIGQGALALETRKDDKNTLKLLEPLHDPLTMAAITAERTVGKLLGADCVVPVGAYAELKNNDLHLNAFVALPDGSKIIKTYQKGGITEAQAIGSFAVQELNSKGAQEILIKAKEWIQN